MDKPIQNKTYNEQQLEEMRNMGLPVSTGVRTVKINRELQNLTDWNKKTLEFWLPKWVRNASENYASISGGPDITWLKGCARKLAVAVVGIGPSLDNQLKDLRSVAGNMLIVATDAALKPLLANGISPQIVMTFDAKDMQYTLFEEIPKHLINDITLLASSCSHPSLLGRWSGPKIFYNMVHRGLDFMDTILPSMYPEFSGISSNGTVGNMAILLADYMEAKSLILLGMDLCYSQMQDRPVVYRCKDYAWKDKEKDIPGRWVEKENTTLYDNNKRIKDSFKITVNKKTFVVDDALDKYRIMCINTLSHISEMDFVDCSDGILGTFGVRQMPLLSAVERYCPLQINNGESVALHLPRILPRASNT